MSPALIRLGRDALSPLEEGQQLLALGGTGLVSVFCPTEAGCELPQLRLSGHSAEGLGRGASEMHLGRGQLWKTPLWGSRADRVGGREVEFQAKS